MEKSFLAFVQAIKDGEDPYVAAGSQIFQVPLKDVTKDQRQASKMRLLQALYGGEVTYDEDLESLEISIKQIRTKMLIDPSYFPFVSVDGNKI